MATHCRFGKRKNEDFIGIWFRRNFGKSAGNGVPLDKVNAHRKTFKKCPMCGASWPDRLAFLSDPAVHLVGYQANIADPPQGVFLFNHSCHSTLGILAQEFLDLHAGPMFKQHLAETTDCPRYCLSESEMRPCPAECECAYVRDVLQIVNDWPKAGD